MKKRFHSFSGRLTRFIGDAEQSDDLTMMVLKMLRKNRD